jgi:hypothetical protein
VQQRPVTAISPGSSRILNVTRRTKSSYSAAQGVFRAVLRDFLKALHETDFKSACFSDEAGCILQVYTALGPEAAYHLVEFISRQGKGHDPDDIRTELNYIGRANRFYTTVQRWQMEVDTEIADNEE